MPILEETVMSHDKQGANGHSSQGKLASWMLCCCHVPTSAANSHVMHVNSENACQLSTR